MAGKLVGMALTREKILDAAFGLLTQYGLADLSMRRLAAELNVAPGALYYHVKNKQDLLSHLASRILDDVGTQAPLQPEVMATEVYARLVAVREGAEVVRLALALHPQRLELLGRLTRSFHNFLEPELAAKTLLHSMLSYSEEEQTRALAAGRVPGSQMPASYLLMVQAVTRGFSTQ